MKIIGRDGNLITAESSNSDLLTLFVDVSYGAIKLQVEDRADLYDCLIQRASEPEHLEILDENGVKLAAMGLDLDGEPFLWRRGLPWPLDFNNLQTTAKIKAIEVERYKRSKDLIGADGLALIQELSDLYELFMELSGETDLLLIEMQPFAFLNCLQACRYQLVLGSLTMLRGHVSDAAFFTRKAIEFFAFVVEIVRNPIASQKWLEAGIDSKASAEYRKTFPIMRTLKKASDVSGDLLTKYDWLSDFVHPSYAGIARHIELDDRVHKFAYFDPEENERDSNLLVIMFINLLQVHTEILTGFQLLLAERGTAFDHSRWATHSGAKFVELQAYWEQRKQAQNFES